VNRAHRETCPVCDSPTTLVGIKHGRASNADYRVARCKACRFAFIADPWIDWDEIYSEAYYDGRGVDPLVSSNHEMAHFDTTIHRYEWQGLIDRGAALVPLTKETAWLDFGSGTGGQVRYLREQGFENAYASEQGKSLERLVEAGIPAIDDQEAAAGSFDVVTSIEVLEHVLDPVAELTRMRRLLKPGGLLFVTTGNAKPYAKKLLDWRYITPECHISLFEPGSLALAMQRAGFEVTYPGFGPGWTGIIRFRALKNLHQRVAGGWERVLPWPLAARALDRRFGLTAHPVGWAAGEA